VNALRQLRYTGLLETIKIRSAGYAWRPTFEEFVSRFKVLVPTFNKETNGKSLKEKCEILLHHLEDSGLDRARLQIGSTKLFLKEQQFEMIQEMREEKLRSSAVLIQNRWKTWYLFNRFKKLRIAALAFQAAIRHFNFRKDNKKRRREKEKKEIEERTKKDLDEIERKTKMEKERKEKDELIRKEKQKKEKEETESKQKLEKDRKMKEDHDRLDNEKKGKIRKTKERMGRERKERKRRSCNSTTRKGIGKEEGIRIKANY